MDPNQNSKPHVFWWTQWGFKIWVHQKTWVFCALMSSGGPKNLMSIDGPRKSLNDMRFWVHQKTWGFGRVVGPSKDMRFWEGKSLKIYIDLMSFDGPNGSIKRHEVVKNWQNLVGSIKRHECRYLGSSSCITHTTLKKASFFNELAIDAWLNSTKWIFQNIYLLLDVLI